MILSIENNVASESPILRLSCTGKSIVATKEGRKWIPEITEIESLFDGVPVDLCAFGHVGSDTKEAFDCERTITRNKDRERFHTVIDERKFYGLLYDLRMQIGSQIRELGMAESAKNPVKIRKLPGVAT